MIRIIFLLVVLVSVRSAYLPGRPFAVLSAPLPSTGRIVAGEETNIKDHPYQIALLRQGNFGCGGSIVKPKAILTGAHCLGYVLSLPASWFSIRAGSSKRNFGGQVIQGSHYYRHEKYSIDIGDYDVAIVALYSAITFSELAAPIALASQGLVVPDGAPAVTSGWGRLGYLDEDFPEVLRKVELSIINQDVCNETYIEIEHVFKITPLMICAGTEEAGQGACSGDSGGPLVVDNTLVGITAFNNLCEVLGGEPTVWVRVSEVREWIDGKLSQIV